MLKIAYCDDRENDRDKIMYALTQIEERWKEEFELFSFSSGESLYVSIAKNHYDIILLDILMDGIDGIETATRLRSMGDESLIIFISNYDKRVKELFGYRTIGFLDKPVDTSKLEKLLSDACIVLNKDSANMFTFNVGGSLQYIPTKDIVYFESMRNKIIIHTLKKDLMYYDTLSSVWQKVEPTGQFVMTHRSFIFNLDYAFIKSNKITIRNRNEVFTIGKTYKVEAQKKYVRYLEKRCK